MRINLNLAKAPFRNRSLFWLAVTAGYLVAFTALALVLARAGEVGASTEELRIKAGEQREEIAALESRIEEIRTERSAAVFTPADRQALDDARALINEKSFSWTKLFNDLQQHVPGGARLTSIAVEDISGDGAGKVVEMTIQGRGRSFGQMGELIANLDSTGGRFAAEPVTNGPDPQTPEYVFTVMVRYRPGTIAAEPVEVAQGERTDG